MRLPLFSRHTKVHHDKLGVPATGWTSKVHIVHRKYERTGGRWKAVQSLSELKLHDEVRLAKKPSIEGHIRHIDEERQRIEFNHLGNPVFAKIHQIKVWVKKRP